MSAVEAAPAAPIASGSKPALQPFVCDVCQNRFTRHENLKRHALLHQASSSETKFPCFHCTKVFARRDLRKRHVKKQHPEAGSKSPPPNATSQTSAAATMGLDQAFMHPLPQQPVTITLPNLTMLDQTQTTSTTDLSFLLGTSTDSQPMSYGSNTGFDTSQRLADTPAAFSIDSLLSSHLSNERLSMTGDEPPSDPFIPTFPPFDNLSPMSRSSQASICSPSLPDSSLSPALISSGVDLFFRHVAPYMPFIHRPTFSIQTTPEPLLMGMLSVALQFYHDKEEGARAGSYCFQKGRRLLRETEAAEEPFSALDLSMVQAYMLMEIHAILLAGGNTTAYGLRMHAKAVELARRGGLTEPYPSQAGATGDLDSLWKQFIRGESHKRTLFAALTLDVFWYHVLSLPRIISHLEVKHELPCPKEMWEVESAGEWAHRALIKDTTKPSVRYIAAIRSCLAATPCLDLTGFDPYGALMVVIFLSSSVREVSGWSTMTGRVCFERFEALHSSLSVFEPLVQSCSNDDPLAVMMQAMWHMAMIELLLWSPSHTGGVVEGSLDAALAAATQLSVSQAILSSPQVVASLDPHVSWYITYLDRMADTAAEAPWVTIFAFKVSLIAWQLVRAGAHESIKAMGISDPQGMYDWIKKIFTRRSNWAVGKLVIASLRELDSAL